MRRLIFVILFGLIAKANQCNPKISKGIYHNLEIHGHVSFECDLSTCTNVVNVLFEKTNVSNTQRWTPVFEEVNSTYYKSLDFADDLYSLKNRIEYKAFREERILNIKSLSLKDQGQWRCVVYNDNTRSESSIVNVDIASECNLPVDVGEELSINIVMNRYTTLDSNQCNPKISKGIYHNLEIHGHVSFECDLSTCTNVVNVLFEKTNVSNTQRWTPVFEEVNSTYYKSLDFADDLYSLKNRHEYKAFREEHVLNIKSLSLKDQGQWRCVVYNDNTRSESSIVNVDIASECNLPVDVGEELSNNIVMNRYTTLDSSSCKPDISKGSHSKLSVDGHLYLECDISSCTNLSRIIFEKKGTKQWIAVVEGINKTVYRALDTGDDKYSLYNRIDYMAFYSQHILNVKSLTLGDTGEWRCVVYNGTTKIAESQSLDLVVETSCRPVLSTGRHSERTEEGHDSLECDIPSCFNVSKITYEKTGIRQPDQWTPVYEGTSKTKYSALDTGTEYSLTNRSEYGVLFSQHILYIKPLVLEDNGEWICVVYDINNRRTESHALDFYIETRMNKASACKPELSEGRHGELFVDGHASFECEISECPINTRVIFEKKDVQQPDQWTKVYEGLNKSDYHPLDTGTPYSLTNRSDYATFYSRHILYIKPLVEKDVGDWRCVLYDQSNAPSKSQAIHLRFVNLCQPKILEGKHGKHVVNGHFSLECEISTCCNISRVEYEKSRSQQTERWTPVYKGISKTNHTALETRSEYSMANRTQYTVFVTQHILYINPLVLEDEGEWRCVVYDNNNGSFASAGLRINIHSTVDETTATDSSKKQTTSTEPNYGITQKPTTHVMSDPQSQSYDPLEVALITYNVRGGMLIVTYFILFLISYKLGFVHCNRCRKQKNRRNRPKKR